MFTIAYLLHLNSIKCRRATFLLFGVFLFSYLIVGCNASVEPPPIAQSKNSSDLEMGDKLYIFHAASLILPFKKLAEIFEAENPGVDVILESSSSRFAIRKVTELNRRGDLVGSADIELLKCLMVPDYSDWAATIVSNRIVLGYTNESKYRSDIDDKNWYHILLRPEVKYGYANRNMAPVGYRTVITWRLADIYYNEKINGKSISTLLEENCPPQFIRPHVNELLPPLTSLQLDYVFLYQSVAMQHRLEWLKLPDEIDLGDVKHRDYYKQVQVEIEGKKKGTAMKRIGMPINLGITMPKDAENKLGAIKFLDLLMCQRGQKVMEDFFLEPLNPTFYGDVSQVPQEIKKYAKEMVSQ